MLSQHEDITEVLRLRNQEASQYHQRHKTLQDQVFTLEAEVASHQSRIETLEAELKKGQQQTSSVRDDLSRARSDKESSLSLCEQLQGLINAATKRASDQEALIAELRAANQSLNDRNFEQQRESAGELNLSRAREAELKAEVERLTQRLQVAETSSESAKKEWAERERVLQERFALTQQLLKRQTDHEEKLKREEMAKQRSAATEPCAPAATLAALHAPREEQPEAHQLHKEDPMQEEKAPTVVVKQTPEEPAHATTTRCSRALEVASPRATSVEPSPRREMPTMGSPSRPVCLINIGDEDEESAIPLVCSPPPKSHQRSAAFPSPKMRAAEPTFFSSLEETCESHRNPDYSKHIANSLASPVVSSPTPDAGSGNRKRSRLRQTQPSTTAAALVERNLCSCGQPSYGLMYRCRICGRPYHKECVDDGGGHTFGALYTCKQCKTDLEQHA